MALTQCSRCRGLVPERRAICPHCDAAVALPVRRGLQMALTAAGGGLAMMISAAACYGGIILSKTCVRLADGGVGTQLGDPKCEPCVPDTADIGFALPAECVNGVLERNDAGSPDAGEEDGGADAGP